MKVGLRLSLAGAVMMVTLSGCGRGFFQAERAPWRHQAEVACLKSGAVKLGEGAVRIERIDGPGVCGMDFPLRVTDLGESGPLGFADELLPPATVPAGRTAGPRWPVRTPHEVPPPPPSGEHLRWVVGPPGIDVSGGRPAAGAPMSIAAPDAAANPPPRAPPHVAAPAPAEPEVREPPQVAVRQMPNDIPPDAIIPPGGSAAVPEGPPRGQTLPRHAYNAPDYTPAPRELPRLGPSRGTTPAVMPQAVLKPPATLACPLVSALDRWVSDGVQPAALHWFGSPVTVIKQIGSYSCRDMIGASGHHISEHAFGDALDIAAFTFANGRTVTVKNGWHGTPEEQGFLHDVQLYACETFTTVLAPGYNPEHYNHIHVDLMRRRPGYRPCRPNAIPGEVVAQRLRARYASKRRRPAYTGSISAQLDKLIKGIVAVPGADGYVGDSDDKADAGDAAAAPVSMHGDLRPGGIY